MAENSAIGTKLCEMLVQCQGGKSGRILDFNKLSSISFLLGSSPQTNCFHCIGVQIDCNHLYTVVRKKMVSLRAIVLLSLFIVTYSTSLIGVQ